MRHRVDPDLGLDIHQTLKDSKVESPFIEGAGAGESVQIPLIKDYIKSLLNVMNLDVNHPSLKETPDRVAEMYVLEAFRGLDYNNFPKCTTIPNESKIDEMIIVRDIAVTSMCEHHLVAFTGIAHVGYVPDKKLLGLSKFNRIVDFFSRRPQVQERLTEQVYYALEHILGTPNVAVIVECVHHCVRLRGVKDVNSSTVTSKMGGLFLAKPEARGEFLKLAKG